MDRGTTKLGMDKIKAASESAAKTSMTLTKSAVSSSVNLTMSAVSSSVDMTKSAASVTTQATTSAVQGTLNMTKSSAAMAGTIGRQGMTGLASLPGGEQAVHLTNRSITMTAKAAKGTFYLGQRGISGTVDAALKATDMATDTVGCDRNRMPLLSKASNVVQNVFFLYRETWVRPFNPNVLRRLG